MARTPRTPPIPPAIRAVIDRLETRGPVRTRMMFGGHGIWCDGRFVAVVAGGTLYLKADPPSRAAFEAAGSAPFRPFPDRPTALGFYTLPADATDDPDTLDGWLDRALTAARR